MYCLLKFLPQYHISPNYFVTLFSSFTGFFTISNYILVSIFPVTMTHLPILKAGISFVWFCTVYPEAKAVPSIGRDLISSCGWSEGLSSGNSSKMGCILVRDPEWSINCRGQPIMIRVPSCHTCMAAKHTWQPHCLTALQSGCIMLHWLFCLPISFSYRLWASER